MKNITEIVAKNLKVLRERKGLKQDELAEQLSIGQSTLSSYERGTRSVPLDMLVTFANFYNVSTDYLMGLSLVQSPNEDMQYIGTYTGLSEDAIEFLHFWNESKKELNNTLTLNRIDLINALFDADNDIRYYFDDVLEQIIKYLRICARIRPYKEAEILGEYSQFYNLEFEDLISKRELEQHKISKNIEKLVESLNLFIVYDYSEGDYIDLRNAIIKDNTEFSTTDEVIKHNTALFGKYKTEIWKNANIDDAKIMLYEENIKFLKKLKETISSHNSQEDGEDNGK